ncbi:hypothetical protein SmJEL517_g01094 [Synchytrium microbalum]|uniref:Major facilitator superfamily (MFS) profile domain-containing protein n=1 Tax=Synchytrium microbalum TaxID=1806994 RepID=A0A507CGI0_9FUNG|nr:uncharacterized protein SmJEL517_g01094 [Synchytrium microbalum]TPX37084.1 hypothetical protein SmJEL517_g01094 [Synchytrium microbalum]
MKDDKMLMEEAGISYTDGEEKAVKRKIDLKVLPLAFLLYICSALDRSNIANARAYAFDTTAGVGAFERSTHMAGSDFNLVLSLFFVPYCVLEPFCNLALIRFKPSVWLSRIAISWGIVSTCFAAASSFSGVMTLRIFLGACEAGLFPGLTFWCTFWYKRDEIGGRIAWFFGASSMATAFSGLLAGAISYMNGISGLQQWQWLFIIEGVPPVLVGIICAFFLPDYPETCKFLNEREKEIAINRLRNDTDAVDGGSKHFKMDEVWGVLKEPEVWAQCLVFVCANVPGWSISYFQPTILTYLGYTGTLAQWMTVPTSIWSAIVLIILSNISDRIGDRSVIIIAGLSVASIAFVVLATVWQPPADYAMLFFTSATMASVPLLHGWVANNHPQSSARGFAMGLINGLGGVAGIIGGQIYQPNDAPHYVRGNFFNASILIFGALLTLAVRMSFVFRNRRMDAAKSGLRRYTL